MIEKKENPQDIVDLKYAMKSIYGILELLNDEPDSVISKIKNKYLEKSNITEDYIIEMINKRKEYRDNKDYTKADSVRNELLEKGIILKDSREGTTWDIEIN